MSTRDDQRRKTNARILAVAAGVAVLLCAVVAIAAAISGGDDEDEGGQATVPAYTLVREDGDAIEVQVDAMPTGDGLRAIFDDVRTGKTRPDGGYFVSINCATGASAGADNRLANGKFAVGNLGEAKTGLKAGGHEFAVVAGRSCPA